MPKSQQHSSAFCGRHTLPPPFLQCVQNLIELWKGRDCSPAIEIRSSAEGQVNIAFEKFKNKEFEDVAYFEPFYLKDFFNPAKKA
jgi:hypothetical protein